MYRERLHGQALKALKSHGTKVCNLLKMGVKLVFQSAIVYFLFLANNISSPPPPPVSSTGCTNVDIGVDGNLDLVDKFCYLGDMLSVDRDADATVETRIRIGWNKFRQLVLLLTNKDISLIVRERLYNSCVQSSMLHGSET